MWEKIAAWLLNILLKFFYKKAEERISEIQQEGEAKKRDEDNAKDAIAELRKEAPAATLAEGVQNERKRFRDFFNRFRG